MNHLRKSLLALPTCGQNHGVTVVFAIPGAYAGAAKARKTVHFTRKPVGFDFHHQAPITVDNVCPQSHAAELGVRKGWEVRSIQGQDMGSMDFESKYQMFVDTLAALPGGMEIIFLLPDGSEKACQFRQQNLGFDFPPEVPIRVDSVFPKSHADEVGVEPGWVIKRINGEDMLAEEFQDYDTKLNHLKKSLSVLPRH